jgi:hypothetical protein
MSKLSLVLAAILVAGFANAEVNDAGQAAVNNPPAGGVIGGSIGTITAPVIVGGIVAAGVVTTVITNMDGDTIDETPVKVLKCDGTDKLVSGLCVGTRQQTKVTVTGSGTGTATRTTTISVPVTFTYAPK